MDDIMVAGIELAPVVVSWLLCFALSVLLAYWLSRGGGWLSPLDMPNERSLHTKAVPRSGGLAVLASAGLASAWAITMLQQPAFMPWALTAVVLVILVSWADDHLQLSVTIRMLVQIGAGVLLVAGGLVPGSLELPGVSWNWPPVLAAVGTMLFSIWMINLFNFMDGMDGFAGGMAAIGFAALGLLGWWRGEVLFALVCSYVTVGSCGFLLVNFPPARIFLGDVGSSGLGIIAVLMTLWADMARIVPLWTSILIFSPFIVDATVTLCRRLLNGEKVWVAHKSHYYQRLVQLGWGHRKTVLHEYLLMFYCAGMAVISQDLQVLAQWLIIMATLALYVALMYGVARMEKGRASRLRR